MRNFLDIKDLSKDQILKILHLGIKIKKNPENYYNALLHKRFILLLEKNSTRTRISFEFGIKELGGHCCVLNSSNTQLSRGESIEDTAKVFNEIADCVIIRTFEHERLIKLANNCKNVSTINALTDHSHPCQIMADLMTFVEINNEDISKISGMKVAWFGDVNNMLISWIEASEKLGFYINVCCPEDIKYKIPESKNCKFVKNKIHASQNCDIITTDTFVSMGENKNKIKMFLDGDFIVDEKVMQNAKSNAIFLHCLPAYRGYEVAEEVIDNPKYSEIVFKEAGNRLHIQKAILMYCFDLI